ARRFTRRSAAERRRASGAVVLGCRTTPRATGRMLCDDLDTPPSWTVLDALLSALSGPGRQPCHTLYARLAISDAGDRPKGRRASLSATTGRRDRGASSRQCACT